MKYTFITIMVALFTVLSGCHTPDDLKPSVSRAGINSITAKFADGTGEFTGYITEGSNEIIIPIPYYYPENSNNRVSESQLTRMRVQANLDDNVTLSPDLLYLDLTQDNEITITDQVKRKKKYVVRGEIRKSTQSAIEEFNVPSLGVSGVVNEAAKTVSLISVDPMEPALAEVKLSAHATISPDPATVEFDYDDEVQFTVTADDGVTQSVYTVKRSIPVKLPYGIRAGSAKLMFAKKLNADLGITVNDLTGGMAVTDEYVVLNTRNANSVYINARTGEKVGEIDLGAIKGGTTNFYNTADRDGNILICNLSPNAGSFKVWRLTSVTGTPELFIEWNAGEEIGRKLSIQGSIDGNAIIMAPITSQTVTGQRRIARWTVNDGVLSSQTPEVITTSGLTKGWTTNADAVATSDTDLNSDYFVASYSDNTFAWVNGTTNAVRHKLDEISVNYIQNAVDYTQFNNASYATVNWVNSQPWGEADGVWLLDVSSSANFSGNLVAGTCSAVVWENTRHIYGGMALSPAVRNINGTGDVALRVSPNGYYLYLYFMFTNGYVVGYQFDCIDM